MTDNTELQAVRALVAKIQDELDTILGDALDVSDETLMDRFERWGKRSVIKLTPYLIDSEVKKFSSKVSMDNFRSDYDSAAEECSGYLIGLTDDLNSYPEGVLKPARRSGSTSTKVKDNPD